MTDAMRERAKTKMTLSEKNIVFVLGAAQLCSRLEYEVVYMQAGKWWTSEVTGGGDFETGMKIPSGLYTSIYTEKRRASKRPVPPARNIQHLI